MTVPNEFFEALEDIVGRRNISRDPAVLDTYRYNLGHTAIHLGPFFDTFTPRGCAVVLPGSTRRGPGHRPALQQVQGEVQGLHHVLVGPGLPVRGRHAPAGHAPDGPHPRDRREEHVRGHRAGRHRRHAPGRGHESRPEHAYPGHRLQRLAAGRRHVVLRFGAEQHVRRLPPRQHARHGVGPADRRDPADRFAGRRPAAGSAARVPAPACAASRAERSGPRARWGSSRRSRSSSSPGPVRRRFPVEGIVPAWRSPLGELFNAYTLAFPSWKAWADAAQLIWETGIGYLAHRQFNMFGRDLKFAMVKLLTDPEKTLEDLPELLADPDIRAVNADAGA